MIWKQIIKTHLVEIRFQHYQPKREIGLKLCKELKCNRLRSVVFRMKSEIDYAASFPRWFVGEAERIQGTTFSPAVAGLRVFTIKQPLGVEANLVLCNFQIA